MKKNVTLDPSTTGPFNRDARRQIARIMEVDGKKPGSSSSFQSGSFTYDSFIYGRYWNPTVRAAEEALAQVEQPSLPSWAVLTSSGMAAIDCALSVFQKHDDSDASRPWLFPSELYGGTLKYIRDVLIKRRGVPAKIIQIDSMPKPDTTEKFILEIENKNPYLVFVETMTNPTLCVLDIKQIIAAARKKGARVIVDNTFPTPLLCSPLDFGADLVVHSVTKFLSGHGNITAGAVCGRSQNAAQIVHTSCDDGCSIEAAVLDYRKTTGCILSPRDAFELISQLLTFKIRFTQASENAMKLAQFLKDEVGSISYPGLPGHPNHPTAKEIFDRCGSHTGAMITISLQEGSDLDRFMDAMEDTVACRLTLGDCSTTILPVARVFGERFSERMVRISVGIEPYEELEAIFDRGIKEAAKAL